MAVPAKRSKKKRDSQEPARIVAESSSAKDEFTPVQWIIVQSYSRGESVGQIARKLGHHLVPHEPNEKIRLRKARSRIRSKLRSQKFRDAIYAEAATLLDLESPAIMRGVARKAKAGRVDAARLAFELNGRHSPHTEIQPAAINIVFAGVPRPGVNRPQIEDPDVIDVDAEVEDDGTEL